MYYHEVLSMYLLLGLGTAIFVCMQARVQLPENPILAALKFIAAFTFGFLFCAFCGLFWPAILMGFLLRKLAD